MSGKVEKKKLKPPKCQKVTVHEIFLAGVSYHISAFTN